MMDLTLHPISFLFFISFISCFASGSIQLFPRQTSGDVDFTNFPACASTCLTRYRTLGCGTTISKDCYCGKPNPLACAWKNDLDVDEGCWNRTEDWYATQCPSVKPIDVASIPTCAVQCFENTKTNLCTEYTKNCVCSNGKPSCTGSASTCNATDLAAYDSWYAGECLYNLTSTDTTTTATTLTSTTATSKSTGTTSATSSATGEPASSGGSSVSTGAIVGASIGGLAGTIIIGALIFFWRRKKPAPQPNIQQTPPTDYSQNPPVRPVSELMGSMTMPPRPVEVPANPYNPPPVYEKG